MPFKSHGSPIRRFGLAGLATLAVMVWLGWSLLSLHGEISDFTAVSPRLQDLRGKIMLYDEILTSAARLAAATGDSTWQGRYESTVPLLDEALAEVALLAPAANQKDLKATDDANRQLIALETQAFAALRRGDAANARKLVYSADYERYKERYAKGMAALDTQWRLAIQDRQTAIQQRTTWGMASCALVAAILGATWMLTRRALGQWYTPLAEQCRRMVGAAQHLKFSAEHQRQSAREQATALEEMATTLNELLVSSRQIGENARFVADAASDNKLAAEGGQGTVAVGQEAIDAVSRQVGEVVARMSELSEQSQEISGILEVIDELAEQTNIVSVNATIEAASFGESGIRFASVANEIRKLAARVKDQTRGFAPIVEQVRSSVKAVLQASEEAAKAVQRGSSEFGQVAQSFERIASKVSETASLAAEIRLSTHQQTSAVEQVHVAIRDLAQAAAENDGSVKKSLESSEQIFALSASLDRLVDGPGRQVRDDRLGLS